MEWIPAILIGYFIIGLGVVIYGMKKVSLIINPHHRSQEKATYFIIGLVWLPLLIATLPVVVYDQYKRISKYLTKRYITWQNK